MKNWKKESRFKDKAEDKLEVRLENAKTRRIVTWIFEILVTLFFAIVVGIMMFQSVTMQESAMEPTLSVGERFLVNKGIYKISSPQRDDIIVFKTNGSDDAALHISRVIGLPGETVQISGGKILINGAVYENDGDFPEISNGGLASSAVSLESGEYFVLGDNRNNSEDSRYADIGNVKKKYIVGKLWFTISPRSKIGFLKG